MIKSIIIIINNRVNKNFKEELLSRLKKKSLWNI